LKKHAERLGVKESDLLLAVKSRDETDLDTIFRSVAGGGEVKPEVKGEGDTVTADGTVNGTVNTVNGTVNTLTIGEEILEVFKMYMARK
jgi:hypothetical protein